MKHKIIIALFLSLLAATYSVRAQSSSLKKAQAELQQKKQHGMGLLSNAHRQQEQAKHEVRPSISTSFQQPTPANQKQAGQQQPVLNISNRKEDINH